MADRIIGQSTEIPPKKIGNNLIQRLSGLWDWLVSPSVDIQQPDLLRQCRLLAAMLVVLVSFAVLTEVMTILSDRYQGFFGRWLTTLFILLLGVAYIFNRRGRIAEAVWITIAVQSVAIISLTFITDGQPVDLDFLTYLLFPLLFASVFLAEGMILVLALLYVGIMLSLTFIPGVDFVSMLLGPASYIVIACGIIYLIFRHRNILEEDRRRELVEKEERYRTLLETSYEGICIVGEGKILDANPNFARMFGYELSEVLGQPLLKLGEQVFRPSMLQQEGNLDSHPTRVPVYKKDGSALYIETVSKLQTYHGEPAQVIAVRDITERRLNEARIQRQLERLNALREIDRMISSSMNLQVTLDHLLNYVVNQLSVDAADILLLNANFFHLEYFAERGFLPGDLLRKPVRMDERLAGRAATERSLVSIADLRSEKGCPRLELMAGQGFQAGFAVPLVAKGMVRGILEVFIRETIEPSLEWKDYLETLGGQAAIAIDNAELFQNLQRTNLDLIRSYDATLEGWAKALELRDEETEGHSQRVTEMTLRLGRAMGVSEADQVQLYRGALLHDIGKMAIPDTILLKPGPLTDEEWVIMKKHPVYANEMLSQIPFLRPALEIPYCHHERWDGSGYPKGLKGYNIPLAARIFMVVDVWDALSSDRPYRKHWEKDKVMHYIRSQAGIQFDPQIVAEFLEII